MPLAKDVFNDAGVLLTQARAIMDEFGDKEMPAEKSTEYDTLMESYDKKYADAQRLARLERGEEQIGEPSNKLPAPVGDGDQKRSEQEELQLKAYRKALKSGVRVLDEPERKALRADDDEAGGVLVMPRKEVQQMLKAVDDMTPTRQLATVHQVDNAESLGVVSLENDPDDADWTSELLTGDEDNSMSFGGRALTPHKLAKLIKLSKKLLRQVPNVETLVRERLAYKFAVPQERAYMLGTGVNQPLGVFTLAASGGISSSRDVTAAAANAIVGDDWINVKHTLKPQYWARARWQMHRDVLKTVRKLKDGNGQYIWQAGLSADTPSTLLEVPYVLNEYAPNSVATGEYVACIADWSFYWIADAMEFELQILRELYARTGQIGYIGELYSDGQPVLEEAFVRLKMA